MSDHRGYIFSRPKKDGTVAWRASIRIDGKKIYLGTENSREEIEEIVSLALLAFKKGILKEFQEILGKRDYYRSVSDEENADIQRGLYRAFFHGEF